MKLEYCNNKPHVAPSAFIAYDATLVGDITVGENASIWYGCVLRADINPIRIGENTNIQDGCVCHVDTGEHSLVIGDNVTVGHNVVLHGCKISDNCLIGMGATVLTGARIGKNCIVGANALVTEGVVIPDNSLVLGMPGKVVKNLSEEQRNAIVESAGHYVKLAALHKKIQK